MEIWKPIKGYESLYEVSSLWNIKSLNYWRTWKEKLLNFNNSNLYSSIFLCKDWIKNNYTVHRIVSQTFIPNKENKPIINHKNWIKTDNSVENLEWCTHKENSQHAHDIWLCKITNNNFFKKNHPSKGKFWKDHFNSKKVNQYTKDGIFMKEWGSIIEIKRDLLINKWDISSCCNWKRKTAGWFIWKFK